MKRILSFILLVMMISITAVSLADDSTIPSIKIRRQMQNDGNGVKGSFRIDTAGSVADHPVIAAVQGAEFDILRNASEDRWHLTVFQQDAEGQQINRTELYREEAGLYLRSDFLPDRVFLIPEATDLIPDSFNGTGENPSILSVVTSLASMTDAEKTRWEPVTEKYSGMLETWLAGYADAPELQRYQDGTVHMKLIYVVPTDDVRREIVNLIKTAAADPEVMTLLAPVMTEEQRAIYLNAGLEEYYKEVMNGIDLQGEIRFEKTVSTMGEMISSRILLPLDPAVTGYRSLEISGGNGRTGYTLAGDTETLRLVIPDGLTEIMGQAPFEGTAFFLRRSTAVEKKDGNLALRIDIRKTYEMHTDEETGRIHEDHHFTVTAERDTTDLPEGVTDEEFPAFDAANIDADFHFSGKAPQSSPVTLESRIDYTRGKFNLVITGKIKTAATWAFVPFSVENVKPLTGMSPEETAAVLAEWIQNAAAGIRRADITEGETGE